MIKKIRNYIKGRKGGGGSAPSPTRTPDNLRSKDTVEVLLGLCEGPIAGLVNGAQSFYVGDTQLQNENGDYNFEAFQLTVYPGEDDPDPIKMVLGGQTTNNSVNLNLASNVSVTRQTTLSNIDFIDIRIAVQRLLINNDSGTFNATVNFRIEYKPLSASTWTKAFGKDLKITGKTSSTTPKEYLISVDRIDEPYEIRITKLSGDNTTTYFADIVWESYQETISDNPSYAHTALAHLVAESSDQFSSIPQWSGDYDGLLVKVPDNYNPETREYTGVWDGTWKIAWTNNPAWCLYDFVMKDRYGIRAYYQDIYLDKYDVYEAAQWCDEQVPDGRGGTQPRYTFNAYLREPRSGKELARYIAGVFNSTFFDDLDSVAYLKVDKDDAASHIFTTENVINGEFEYTYTDITTRYNDITVSFTNPNLNWETDRRRVYDDDLIAKHGRIPLDFIAVGCLDPHEAVRRAQYKLITSNTETCIVRFTTNRLGQFVNPFDVILISDEDMGYGLSGRVKTIGDNRTSITLRDPVYLEAGVDYKIRFVLSDGSNQVTDLENYTSGYNSTLQFSAPLPENNTPDKTVFTIESADHVGNLRPFRVTKVVEVDGNADQYEIEAININRNKWYDSDNVTDSGTINYSALPDPLIPPGPTNVAFQERYVKKSKEFQTLVSPVFNRGAYKYYTNDHSFEVWSRPSSTSEPFVRRELRFGDTLINHPSGTYDVKVLGKSYLGRTTPLDNAATYVFNFTNPTDPPKDIDWIKINQREVYWGYENAPDDFAGFQVRYHNQANRTTWNDAAQPHQGLLSATSFYTDLIPPTARVIMVRAVDDFGVTSQNSAIIYRQEGQIVGRNTVEQFDFHPTFSGTKQDCSVVSGELVADDTGTQMYSNNPNAFFYDGGDLYEASYNTMIYYPIFNSTSDGELYINIDCDNNGYEINIREAGETNWQPMPRKLAIEAGNYELQVKIFGGPVRGVIRSLSAVIDVEDVREVQEDLVIPAAATRITLQKSYSTIKVVSVIIQGVSSTAVTYRVNDKNTTLGPEIELLDKDGNVTSGTVDVVIEGY